MNEANARLAQALIALGATITHAMDSIEDFVPCGRPAQATTAALICLNEKLSETELNEQESKIRNLTAHVSEKRGVPVHPGIDPAHLGTLKRGLLSELIEVARAIEPKGTDHQTVNIWMYRSLAALEHDNNYEAQQRVLETGSIKAAIKLL